jgi:mono/diheme cytochrome c family protein
MEPRPRDFTTGTFKCRSTPTGTLPLDTDVLPPSGAGSVASSMPSWKCADRAGARGPAGVRQGFLSALGRRKAAARAGDSAGAPGTPESITRGGKIYERMECWKCHGKDGSGNGPSATTLTDNKDRPIVPYDFTKGTRFKCGRTNQDLYKIFMTGLDGTPMPSFKDNLPPDEAWDLVHYLRTLQAG